MSPKPKDPLKPIKWANKNLTIWFKPASILGGCMTFISTYLSGLESAN